MFYWRNPSLSTTTHLYGVTRNDLEINVMVYFQPGEWNDLIDKKKQHSIDTIAADNFRACTPGAPWPNVIQHKLLSYRALLIFILLTRGGKGGGGGGWGLFSVSLDHWKITSICADVNLARGLRECMQNCQRQLTAKAQAMFTRDRSQMDPTLSWNGPFLFTRHLSAYQHQATRDRSVMVRYWIEVRKAAASTS